MEPETFLRKNVSRSAGKKLGGVFLIDGKEVADTVRCCHCGGHFTLLNFGKIEIRRKLPDPSRGNRLFTGVVTRQSGFCQNCGELTCGDKECSSTLCIPIEKKMDEYEEGKRQSLHYWDPDAR